MKKEILLLLILKDLLMANLLMEVKVKTILLK